MIRNTKNIGCGIFFIMIITFPLFFTTFIIVRNQVKEYFIYGEIIEGVVLNKEGYWSSSSKGINNYYWNFSIKPLDKQKNFTLDVYEPSENNMVNNLKIGDTLMIKVQTEKQARIIIIKGKKINNENNYFWIFVAPILLILGILPYYLLFKQRKKQNLFVIKLLIFNMLLAFVVVYFFTS